MNTRKQAFFRYLFERRKTVIAASFALLLLCLFTASGITLKEDVMDLLPTGDPVVRKYQSVLVNFQRLDYMLFDVGPRSDDTPVSEDELTTVADYLADQLSSSPYFSEVKYRWDMGDVSEALDVLRLHRADLFTEQDRNEMEERLRPEKIREALQGWKRLLTESPVPVLSGAFMNDPLGMDGMLMRKLEAVRSLSGTVKMMDGRLVSTGGHILIMARPVWPGSDSLHAAEIISFVDKTIRGAEAKAKAGGTVRIAYMGSHRFSLDNSGMIKGDIQRTLTISGIAIALLTLLVFRRPIVMTVLAMFPALFGGAVATAVMMLVYPEISGIALGCGAMLIGIVVDFSIHFLYHVDRLTDEEYGRPAVIGILDRLSVPLMLTAATTMTAFLTLQLSVMPGYRQTGLFAALGIAAAFCFAIMVLPLLLSEKAGRRRGAPTLSLSDIYPPFFRWSERNRTRLLVLTCLLTLVAALGLPRLDFEGDIKKLNAMSAATKRDMERVIQSFGDAMSSTSVVITADDTEEALRQNDRLNTEILALQKGGMIKRSDSLAALLPGQKSREENRRRWAEFWDEERTTGLKKEMISACRELRIHPGIFDGFMASLHAPVPLPLGIDSLDNGILRELVGSRISVKDGKTMVLTNLALEREEDFPEVARTIESAVTGAGVTSGGYFVRHVVYLIHQEMKRLGGITLIFVAIAMAVYARRARTLAKLLLPLFLSLLWTFGVMGWLGMKVNIMNAVIVVFIFGIVDDYCVFLHSAWEHDDAEDDEHLSHTSGAITISAISTLLGLGSLVFAQHPALHTIGATSLLGISIGMAAAFLVVPLGGRRERVKR